MYMYMYLHVHNCSSIKRPNCSIVFPFLSPMCYTFVYMKVRVYSTLDKLVVKEEKKENPDPIHHTKTIQTRKHKMTRTPGCHFRNSLCLWCNISA